MQIDPKPNQGFTTPMSGLASGATDYERPVRLCLVVAAAGSIQTIYRGRLEYLQREGFDVTVVCSPSDADEAIRARGVRLHPIEIPRAITPWRDVRAIWRLWRFLRRERFDLVEVGFPKSALVASIAARLARVPVLIHILHGLAYEGRSGAVRTLLWLATIVPCRLADITFSVSTIARDMACRDHVSAARRIVVLGNGSFGGVDTQRFSPEQRHLGPAVRARYDIPASAVVVGFVGRLSCEKGLVELVEAFPRLALERRDVFLLLVGDYEHKEVPSEHVVRLIRNHPRIRATGWQADTVPLFAAMDMVVLPSHREGFGNVLSEAAAMGLPTISSDVTGYCHSGPFDSTGLKFPVRDTDALYRAIAQLADDPELRRRLGANGRRWVVESFDERVVWRLYRDEYRRLALQARRSQRHSRDPVGRS